MPPTRPLALTCPGFRRSRMWALCDTIACTGLWCQQRAPGLHSRTQCGAVPLGSRGKGAPQPTSEGRRVRCVFSPRAVHASLYFFFSFFLCFQLGFEHLLWQRYHNPLLGLFHRNLRSDV